MRYENIEARFQKLERRNLGYQFDLERDVAWARAAEPGLFLPWRFVSDLGVPVESLRAHSAAAEVFQWSYALSICEVFIALEEIILTFADVEKKNLPATRSLDLLCVEERKHVELFRRLAEVLRASRPDAVRAFDTAYASTGAWFEERRVGICTLAADAGEEQQGFQHYLFWLLTMFFEEFTIYLDDLLQESDGIQPLWASAHAAHRREEIQHVVTDLAYLDTVQLDAALRDEWSEMFVASLARGLPRFTAYEAAIATTESLHPELPRLEPNVSVTRTPFFRSVCEASQFRRTRQHAPALVRHAQRRDDR